MNKKDYLEASTSKPLYIAWTAMKDTLTRKQAERNYETFKPGTRMQCFHVSTQVSCLLPGETTFTFRICAN